MIRRLAIVPATLLGITLVTFLLMHMAPGDPASLRAGQSRGASAQAIAAYRHAYGLDRSLGAQYLDWLQRSVTLDFGDSLADGRPVRVKLAEALPRTAALALLATFLAYLFAVPLGVVLAARDGRALSRTITVVLYAVYALPVAALAMFLRALGAPYGGAGALLAAAGALALYACVRLSRHQRSALLGQLRSDFVRTARAMGAGDRRVLFRHALPGALLPMITLLGSELPALLSGSVIVEQVFGVRGIGLCGFDAVLARDYPMLLGLATVAALITVAGVLTCDLLTERLDPRLRGRAT
jgi:peptide/nickel transport system permease protein